MKDLQVPPEIVTQIVEAVREDKDQLDGRLSAERTRLQSRVTLTQNRVDAAYTDKLNGKISDEFWKRKNDGWQMEEQQAKMALASLQTAETSDRASYAQKVFELANRACYLYLSQDSTEKAKLLKLISPHFSVDAVSATPTYRYPFDLIFKRAKLEEWSGRLDSN